MGRFGSRHDKAYIHPPSGTEFVFVKFPPSGVSVSAVGDVEHNVTMPSAGTYRLSAGTNGLSTDHQASMAIPLYGQYLDVDLAGGSFLRKINGINMLASPEYFVPPGFNYNPCFMHGGCPDELLEAMHRSTSPTIVYYYSIQRVARGLDRIPLRQVGNNWEPSMTEQAADTGADLETLMASGLELTDFLPPNDGSSAETLVLPNLTNKIYVPAMSTKEATPEPPPVEVEPDDPNGCPCGWFDKDGRMLDFIPGN
jgi:hypothetical protein